MNYAEKAYTGLTYPTEKYFPTWVAEADDPQVVAAVEAHKELFGKPPIVDRWTFSTNGVSIGGMFGIPCVGFGPAPEDVAHTVNDSVPIEHLVRCCRALRGLPRNVLRPGRQKVEGSKSNKGIKTGEVDRRERKSCRESQKASYAQEASRSDGVRQKELSAGTACKAIHARDPFMWMRIGRWRDDVGIRASRDYCPSNG